MVLFNVMSLMKTVSKMALKKPTGEVDKCGWGEPCEGAHWGKVKSDALAAGDKAWRGTSCQILGPPGVKDTCRDALEEGRTSVSLPSDDSRRGLRKDSQKNEQETPGRVERGPQAPLLSPGHLWGSPCWWHRVLEWSLLDSFRAMPRIWSGHQKPTEQVKDWTNA